MMTEENKKVLDDLVYLAACAVNGQVPEKSRKTKRCWTTWFISRPAR